MWLFMANKLFGGGEKEINTHQSDYGGLKMYQLYLNSLRFSAKRTHLISTKKCSFKF